MGQTHETIMSLANALLSKMSSISYRPINSSKIKGQPHVECGDFISGEVNGYGFEAYVFQRDLTGIKALRDAYICKGKELLENDMNGVTATLQRLNSSIGKTKVTIEKTEKGLRGEISQSLKESKKYTDESSSATLDSANEYTDNSLTSYVTEQELTNTISITSEGFNAEIKKQVSETKSYADSVASTAGENAVNSANSYTDNSLGNYTTNEVFQTTIDATNNKISTEVSRAKSEEEKLSSKITETAETIKTEVSQTYETKNNADSRQEIIQSSIEQASSQIVLKVDANGKIVQVALTGDITKGTEFKVNADNINLSASDVINLLANGNINLTGKNITITSTNFNVDKDGNMVAKNGKFEGNITSNNAIINGGNINIAGDSQDDARINLYYDKYQTVLLPMGLMGKNNGVTKTYFSTVGGMLRLSDQTGNYTNNITHAGISCPTVQAISRLYVGGTYAENSISKITCGTATCNGSGNTSVVLDGVSGGSNCAFFLTNADISISYAHIEGSQISGNTVYANLDRALNSGQIIKIAWVKFEW